MKNKINIVRLLLVITGIALLIAFAAPLAAHILCIGNALGIAFSAVMIIAGAFLNPIIRLVKKIRKKKSGKIITNTIFSCVTIVMLCFFIALGATIGASSTNADGQNTVIVLGCAVHGETPSLMLSYRINSAYDYLTKNPKSVAILSGGQGRGESISEAQCMFNELTKKGIAPSRLYLEDKSTNTFENISFSKNIIEKYGLSTDVAVATSNFHLKRATMIAEKQGLTAKRISADTSQFLIPTYYVRDTLGVIKEFIIK